MSGPATGVLIGSANGRGRRGARGGAWGGVRILRVRRGAVGLREGDDAAKADRNVRAPAEVEALGICAQARGKRLNAVPCLTFSVRVVRGRLRII